MFISKSIIFHPEFENKEELSDEIIIPSYHLNKMMKQYKDATVLYATITNTDNNQSYLVTIGSPHNYDKNTIFVPQWILDIIGSNDSVIKIKKANDIPVATKIIIKPLDPVAFQIDTLHCFEKAFMNLHSIREGITVPIITEIGTIFAYIEKVEPAGISKINGDVNVEFINEFTPDISSNIPDIPSNQIISGHVESAEPLEPVEPLSPEERRKQVRDSWAKRYQC
jgi:hypothetical protein